MGRFKNNLEVRVKVRPIAVWLILKLTFNANFISMTTQTMKSNYTYSLVKEAYASEDARELLMAIVAGTSRFHSLKNLRSWETKGAKDERSEKRIKELDEIRENILEVLDDLDGENLSIEISTEVKVSPKKDS